MAVHHMVVQETGRDISLKSVLFSSCYLDGKDKLGNDRFIRTVRYLRYYKAIDTELGFDRIMLLDNGSEKSVLGDAFKGVTFISLPHIEHHDRIPHHYPHCWRTLYYAKHLIDYGCKKIIMIDTDGFVVSKKLAHYIRDLNSEWTTFWCKRWNFPDAAISVLCEDAFPRLLKFMEKPWEEKVGSLMERELPFSKISFEFNCDRFGEWNAPLTENIDYYGQAGPSFIPKLGD